MEEVPFSLKKKALQWTEINYDVQYKFIAVFLKLQQDNWHISLFFRLVSLILKECVMWQVSHWILEYVKWDRGDPFCWTNKWKADWNTCAMCHPQLHWGQDKHDLNLGLWVANILLNNSSAGIWFSFPFWTQQSILCSSEFHWAALLERLLKLSSDRCVTGAVSCTTSCKVFVNLYLDINCLLVTAVIMSHKLKKCLLTQTAFACQYSLGIEVQIESLLLNTKILKWKKV